MNRDFLTPDVHPAESGALIHRAGSCMALVDERFLAWLATQGAGGAGEAVNRHGLLPWLASLLVRSGLEVDLRRVYWYSDRTDGLVLDDQIGRAVRAHDADGGASLLRALGQDLRSLAGHRACEHVLVASDDERLLPLIDEAQLRGLAVHLLAGEGARRMEQLSRDDPGWARLLAQADRRVLVGAQALADLAQGRPPLAAPFGPAPDPEALRQPMSEEVQAWWADEPEDLREDLREALQLSRGIPQEVDRALLLRMRRRLTRALSLPEKKLLRDMVRATVLAGADGDAG